MATPPARESCPRDLHPEIAADYAARRLPPSARRAFEAHYFACDRCFEDVRLATDLSHALSPAQEPPLREALRRPRGASAWRGLAAAAALAIAVVGVWWGVDRSGVGSPPALRGAPDDLAASAVSDPEGLRVTWDAIAGADGYVVHVFGVDGELRLERETRETTLRVPAAEVPGLGGSAALYVQVEAIDPLRKALARSTLIEVGSGGGPLP